MPLSKSITHTGHFYGGPRDGEVHEFELLAPRALFPGYWEERRAVRLEDGTWSYSYPTVVYEMVASMGAVEPADCRDHIYRYVETLPA